MSRLPQVTRYGVLDMQVCVPKEFTDEEVKAFADSNNISGTESGWHIRREGDKALGGHPERNPCLACGGNVHIMLDC